jgi:drug/metabolite transporter (DMT)-like permease
MRDRNRHIIALISLTSACLLWGLSFPTMKALNALLLPAMANESTWFVVGLQGGLRFLVAGLIMLIFCWRILRTATSLEWKQGIGLSLFGGFGMILQVDGLAYTDASVSAFLTQAYCVILPLYHAARTRRIPTARTWIACVLVLLGVGILARFDWHAFRLGRGEFETLISSVFFTGQILWLERPDYSRNRTRVVSTLMFLGIGLMFGILGLTVNKDPRHFAIPFESFPILVLLGALVLFCTLGAFNLMNHWQKAVTSTEAGLIYTGEPVFASLFALFLPSLLAQWTRLDYQNEVFSSNLIIGGGLIVGANLVMQLGRISERPKSCEDQKSRAAGVEHA